MQHTQPTSMRCPRCGGSGKRRGRIYVHECSTCHGTGRVTGKDLEGLDL
ncbi:hypothetical protein OHA25_31915 [Nonomuraea sp. NBC_00507]